MNSRFKVLIILICCAFFAVSAHDTIVLKDGTLINSIVSEISETSIKYKKASNPNGPNYTISIDKVLSINFENGEIERFESASSQEDNKSESVQNAQNPKERVPNISSNNTELIAQYNHLLEYKEDKPKDKKAKKSLIKWGITSESVLSNEDIEVSISVDNENGGYYKYIAPYILTIQNKTNDIIYVDLCSSYAVNSLGQLYPYFDSTEIISTQNSSGVNGGLGLGAITGALGVGGVVGTLASGLSVGAGKSNSTTTQYNPNAVITIPPKSKVPISYNKLAKVNDGYKFITVGEGFNVTGIELEAPFEKGQIVYDESNTPLTLNYSFTYILKSKPESYSKISLTAFVQQILGVNPNDSANFDSRLRWSKYPRPKIGDVIPTDKTGYTFWFADGLEKLFKNFSLQYTILGK